MNTGFLLAALLCPGIAGSTQEEKSKPAHSQAPAQEEIEDYFKKWLDQDVIHIISEEERKVFQNLTTSEEKEQFIEQFWYRRNPDPRSFANEFKEEHYRRIAYANERFSSGIPGWLTDRGRIYIIHGPPAEIESRPTGGMYDRPQYEGGGTTSTYPFETWRYRYIEGMGSDIVIEFVDPSLSGEFRLALHAGEKDALLHVPGGGLNAMESMGLSSKADRAIFSGASGAPFGRAQDQPFARYERYVQVQRAPPVKYGDLKSFVEIDVSFDNLPFSHRIDYFNLNEDVGLVALTVEIDNRELTFAPDETGPRAKVAVYGIVTSLSNRISDEFEADVVAEGGTPAARSAYQRILLLERKGRYKLDLVIKDLNRREGRGSPSGSDSATPKDRVESQFRFAVQGRQASGGRCRGGRNVRAGKCAHSTQPGQGLRSFGSTPSLPAGVQRRVRSDDHAPFTKAGLRNSSRRPKSCGAGRRSGTCDSVSLIAASGPGAPVLFEDACARFLPDRLNLTVHDLIQDSEVQVTDRFEVASKSGS